MDFSNFRIQYKNDDVNKNLIQEYWEIKSLRTWNKHVEDIATSYDMASREVTSYVRQNSELTISCVDCKEDIITGCIRSDMQLNKFFERGEFICEKCYNEKNKKLSKSISYETIKPVEITDNNVFINKKLFDSTKINFAFETEQWEDLNDIELEVLIQVAESTSTTEAFANVFQWVSPKSEHGRKYWDILKKLERSHLIWMERDKDGSILQIHKHGRLYKKLLAVYPDLVRERKIKTEGKRYSYKFFLNEYKTKNEHPIYSGKIKPRSDLILKKGSEYTYGIWVNEDSLSIRIEEINLNESKP